MGPLLSLLSLLSSDPTAAGKWRVNSGQSVCTAARTFSVGAGSIELSIEQLPFGRSTEITLVGGKSELPARVGGDVLVVAAPGTSERPIWSRIEPLPNDRRAIQLTMPANYVQTLSRARTLKLNGDTIELPALPLGEMAAVGRAMATCERQLATDLGIDEATIDKIVVPAVATKPEEIFTSDDYPSHAIRANMAGEVDILWRIDPMGRPQDCRVIKSSSHDILDRTACLVVLSRARFKPALDGGGKPVDGYMSRHVRWRLPGY